MGTPLSTTPGFSNPSNSESVLQQELDQARLQQMQVQTQLQSQLLKQSKGPGTFRKVLGAITGVAANIVAPGLGSAIGNMIMGNNRPAVANFGGLNAGTVPGNAAGLGGAAGMDQLNTALALNNSTTDNLDKYFADTIKQSHDMMDEIAALPKGPDPVAFLAWQEKQSEQSEIFQATSAVAKTKHEAAMAAIQNIKD
jgi:hypothetical protein